MKTLVLSLLMVMVLSLIMALPAQADKPTAADSQGNETAWDSSTDGNRIKDGVIKDSAGNVIVLGYDQFGYNYQAHMFNGTYDSVDRKLDGKYWGQTGDYVDDNLIMKWSDDWLSNVDRSNDWELDRGAPDSAGFPNISQGWLTNQVEGDYDSDGDGTQDAHYTSFTKIVWVGPGGGLWGQYEIIQEVGNDPVGGVTGLQLKVGAPGFGLNDQWTTQ